MTASLTPAAEAARYVDSLGTEALAMAQAYTIGNHWLLFAGVLVSIMTALVLVRTGLMDRIAGWFAGRRWALATFLTGGAFSIVVDVIQLPWHLLTGWHRERAFGLSSQPLSDYLGQWTLDLAINAVLGGLFLLGIYTLIRRTGARWWAWASGFTAIAIVLFLLALPSVIQPLFNKYEPVPPGPVRVALEQIADDVGIPHNRIFLFDGSRQSDRFTANVTGIGPSARIAISDVALKNASIDEVRAVTAHEAGHYKLGHIWRTVLFMPLLAMLTFWLTNRLFAPTARLLGSTATLPEPRGLPVFMVLWSVLSLLATPLQSSLTRIGEREADAYSLRTVNEPDALASALVKTAEYRYPRPTPLQEVLFYTHPSVEKRVLRAMEWKAAHPRPAPVER
ncbi:MAG: M48 family metallopeptidase [Sphingomonadales bacterium]|nr:M48 family metallopeptidase [Sphingomonadales bacterium]